MKTEPYRVGNHQPQNIYRGDQYIGVMFSPIDAAAAVRHLNMGVGECTCNSYEPCSGECCGVGMCSCSAVTKPRDFLITYSYQSQTGRSGTGRMFIQGAMTPVNQATIMEWDELIKENNPTFTTAFVSNVIELES